MSLRSPLARARGLGSAKSGVEHWWAQRLTAAALVPLAVWFVIALLAHVGGGHEAAVAWIGHPVTAVLLVLLVVATFHHAQLGLQVVIEDYVHTEWLKVGAIAALKGVAVVLALIGIFSVLKIAFGTVA